MKNNNSRTERRTQIRSLVNPKLRRSIRLFFGISIVILLVVIFDTWRDHANPLLVLLGLAVGTLVGTLLSRMYKISWDDNGQHVTNTIDKLGALILVAYIAFDLLRGDLTSLVIHGSSIPAVSLSLLAGALYGRVLGSGRTIFKVIKQQQVFKKGEMSHE